MSDTGEPNLMGDIAELILTGVLCEECGSLIDGEATMFPRKCEDCK
jgi:hypothetical protein